MGAEIDLARRLLAGDASAFDDFVRVFRGKVYQYSYLMCGQREDAEEIAQETLMKVFQNFKQLREPEHVKAWIFRIAKNACTMRRRKSTYAPSEEISLDQLRPSWNSDGEARRLEIADWSALPDQRAISTEMAGILRQSIRELPDIYRSVLLLRDMEELSTAETASILDVTEDVVKTRLHRARLAVRQRLDEHLRSVEAAV
ncbi:MAG: sigma-70 family RNA polymerase sigma factor [Bryobacteraceae bacterium]